MRTKSAFQSAFFNPRALISLAFCASGVLLAVLAFAFYAGGNALAAPKQLQNQLGVPLLAQVSGTVLDGRTTEGPPPTLGNYPATSVPLGGDTMVPPHTAPANTTSINVATNTNFKGTFAANPTTGVVTVTNAHPAGAYTVTVTAFGPGGTTTKTFALAVTSTPCGAGLTAGFTNAADVSVGSPGPIAIGDFNGDGKQDLAISNSSSRTVSIRLGDGAGGFSSAPDVSVGPGAIAIGDFNGDGKQDLAVGDGGLNAVAIRLGDGLGGFSGSTEVYVYEGVNSIAIGDFNGDGQQDLAIANGSSSIGLVSIRLGDGLGGFSGSTELNMGFYPGSVAIGDFNGDGKQDLAVATYSQRVRIRLGDGLGGFSAAPDVYATGYTTRVAIGDFNGDGKQDFTTGNGSIRLGDGLGGFTGSTVLGVGGSGVAIGDFNGDGQQDLAFTNGYYSNSVTIRLGDGSGGFSGLPDVNVGPYPFSLAIGDFNGDGKQDLAVASSDNAVSIRLGQCIPCVAIPAGLVSWWPLETDGTDIYGSNSGTLPESDSLFGLGKVGGALYAYGTHGISVPSSASLNFGANANFSIDAWIRVTDTARNTLTIVDKRLIALPNVTGYALYLFHGHLRVELAQGASPLDSQDLSPDLRDGQWHHVAVSIVRNSASGGHAYVDGSASATFDPTSRSGSLANNEPFLISQNAQSANADFIGNIDELDLFN